MQATANRRALSSLTSRPQRQGRPYVESDAASFEACSDTHCADKVARPSELSTELLELRADENNEQTAPGTDSNYALAIGLGSPPLSNDVVGTVMDGNGKFRQRKGRKQPDDK